MARHLAGIVLMGGAMSEGGNITPAAEFNFYVDPEAAAQVFSSGAAITMIPLDCTHQALITDERLEILRAAGTPVGTAFYHLLEWNKRFDRAKYGWAGGPLHDPTVTAYLLSPELFAGRTRSRGYRMPESSDLGRQRRGLVECEWKGPRTRWCCAASTPKATSG